MLNFTAAKSKQNSLVKRFFPTPTMAKSFSVAWPPSPSYQCQNPESTHLFSLTPCLLDVKHKTQSSRRNILAVHPSVIKRHEQSLKRRARNVEIKSKLRTLVKKARQAVEGKNREAASVQIRAVNKELGKAVSKGIIKRNTASRWLSRLSRLAARIAAPS
jgi:small subunit ribosomal protein S20